MKIVYAFADTPKDWNSSEWRCAVPARAFNRTGRHQADLISLDDFAYGRGDAPTLCQAADVIVVERNLVGPVLTAIQHWKARDKIVLANFDDAYDKLPSHHPSYDYWIKGERQELKEKNQRIDPVPLTQFRWGLRLVDGAGVPSKRLAADWQAFTDVHYLPNYFELDMYAGRPPVRHDNIVIGWGGSVSHLQSFTDSGIIPALRAVVKSRPQVRLMICGSDTRILRKLNLPTEKVIHNPWVPYRDWSRTLSMFDIGLAPLSGEYDERRSWIKVMEYMLMKVPWVASAGPAYGDLRPYGWLVENKAAAWERVLLDMVDHIDDYKAQAGRDPYLHALSMGIDDHVDEMVQLFASFGQRATV